MTDKSKQKKHGTHRRISDENVVRIKAIGQMGDSVNKVIGVLLDNIEDVNRCLNGDEPQTEELRKLKSIWSEEAIKEHLEMSSYHE